ncbi:hypothetical protein GW17_00044792, partial [Ensete ventricosum]
ATVAFAHQQLPCSGAATSTANVVALLAAAPCERPAAGPPCGLPTASDYASGQCFYPQASPLRSAATPYGLSLAVIGRTLEGGLGCGLAVGGRPYMGAGRPSSSLPLLFLSRPSGDSVLVAIVPSSSALGDSRTVIALAVMRSYFNVDSIVTTHRLVEVRKNYFIPLEYELHVPLPRERPYDTSQCGFSLSTDALEAGLRFSLHPVIEACLEQWRISPSQMVPNSWWAIALGHSYRLLALATPTGIAALAANPQGGGAHKGIACWHSACLPAGGAAQGQRSLPQGQPPVGKVTARRGRKG